MDWRSTGEAVRQRWRECLSEHAKEASAVWIKAGCDPDEIRLIEIPFVWVDSGIMDSPLRFTREDYRKWSFSLPKERFDVDDLNGRPRRETLRVAAALACRFYDAWRAKNREYGVRDYGHRGGMKEDAARFIVEDLFAWRFADGVRPVFLWELGWPENVKSLVLAVCDLMDKPQKRREPRQDGTVEYLGSGHGLVLNLPPELSESG